MKHFILLALLLSLFVTPCFAQEYHLDYTATFTPPHSEAIVGSLVERYRIELIPTIVIGNLELETVLRAQGANKWQPSSVVGNGFPAAWENSDWQVKEWRYSYTVKATYWINEMLGLYLRSYNPIDRHSWGSHGNEKHYDMQVGLRGRLF